jgi:5-hydroxyisourate hydrolase-like protein (transthyretin family)
MKKTLFLYLLFCGFASNLMAVNIRGKVVRSGKVIRNVPQPNILIEIGTLDNAQKWKTLKSVYSEKDGIFLVDNLAEGTYYIRIAGNYYKVDVKALKNTNIQDIPMLAIP